MEKKDGFSDTVSAYLYMFKFLKGSGVAYIFGVLLLSCCGLMESIFTGQLYQAITSLSGNGGEIASSLVTVAVLALAMSSMVILGNYLYSRSTAGGDMQLRKKLISCLVHMPLPVFSKRQSADWFSVLGKDSDDAVESYKLRTTELLSYGIQAVGGFIMLIAVSKPLAFCALSIGVVYMGIGMLKRKRMKKFTSEQRSHSVVISNQMQNLIEGALTSRFYNLSAILRSKLDSAVDKTYNSGKACAHIVFLNAMLSHIGYMLAYTGPMILGLFLVNTGTLELSQMVSVWPIAVGVAFSVQKIGFFFTTFQSTASAIERVRDTMQIESEVETGSEILPASDITIEFKDVSFAYNTEFSSDKNSSEKSVLSNVSFKINQGEHIAFVGESGSGKTTLMKLLLRFYQPTSGEILINGKPISMYTLSSVRSRFSYVPQTTHLLDDTVYNNIAIVKQDATIAEVEAAAIKSYSAEFIEQLESGYNTVLGENGSNLSGGQRQRISIARAFISNTNGIIFDEITSALDNESEQRINFAIDNMDNNKTLLMITHKLSSARDCDRIIAMKDGFVCEIGSHDDLLAQNGFYAELWNKQAI